MFAMRGIPTEGIIAVRLGVDTQVYDMNQCSRTCAFHCVSCLSSYGSGRLKLQLSARRSKLMFRTRSLYGSTASFRKRAPGGSSGTKKSKEARELSCRYDKVFGLKTFAWSFER